MTISQFPIPAGGIPTGDTAGRPASPVIGDVYYNGQKAILEIYDGTNWVPCSAPAAIPTIAVADVGTNIAYGSAQGVVTITPGTSGGPADTYLISSSTGGYTATTTGTTVTITVGNNGSWTFSGQGINNFGTSVAGPSVTQTLTTVPQAPTIGTATTSGVTSDVTVTWTLNNNGGKNLTAIEVVPYLNGTTAQTATTAATTTATSAVISGLTMNSSYTFKVRTVNANGTGLESSATNSVTVPLFVVVDYLVIAGGGGGSGGQDAYTYGGGGGAGGYRTSAGTSGANSSAESSLAINKGTNYTVTIGAGGAGSTDYSAQPGLGGNSVFSTITSTGGGSGGNYNAAPRGGGSGGGVGVWQNNTYDDPGLGTANQGRDGGTGAQYSSSTNQSGGGGGGASANGGNANGSTAGAGGAGIASTITGSSVTRAGGGGGSALSGTAGAGGAGGGGAGANVSGGTGGSGTANTGSGGGGAATATSGFSTGGNGGSGVVILRWLTSSGTITVGAGLTADATGTDGSYSYKRFTAGTGNVSWS